MISFLGQAQFNNSWIDYNKTYYKFKTPTTGIYRIGFQELDRLGLAGTPAEHFQLWRNGRELTLYTSKTSGAFGATDYIEFWLNKNDGELDKRLYRKPEYQHTAETSLFTDSVAIFLTVDPGGNNKRFQEAVNEVAGNTLPKENFFMHTVGNYYKNQINPGFAEVIGEYVYSSSFDRGEFWSTGNLLLTGSGATFTFPSLFPYAAGGNGSFKFGIAGAAPNPRIVKVNLGTEEKFNMPSSRFDEGVYTIDQVGTNLFSAGTLNYKIYHTSDVTTDRFVVSFAEFTYPRQFNFGNSTAFRFKLPASPVGNYLEITNFNAGGAAPVLYDETNQVRYVATTTMAPFKYALQPSAQPRTFIMVSQQVSNLKQVVNMQRRDFVNYTAIAADADYCIISHSALMAGANNPVQQYRNYRSSGAGGNYRAHVFDIDELEDQFAYGINKHPLSIKNFLAYRSSLAVKPKFVFLIGRGVVYNSYYANQATNEAKALNLIPTFGNPGSDNFLAAAGTEVAVPIIPIGRLSAVNATEVQNFLDKVILYEQVQQTASCSIADKAWMKNVIQVTGSSEAYLGTVLCNYMHGYQNILTQSTFGAKVATYCKTSTSITKEKASEEIAGLFKEGLSILNYFGHSSASVLEFSIKNPEEYENYGKYPVFMVNGCNAGNYFTYDLTRIGGNKTISENFMLAKDRGSIAFLASTHLGVVNYLDTYITNMYSMLANNDYGATLGTMFRDALEKFVIPGATVAHLNRVHIEQLSLHGDPAIRINNFSKPDYAIEEAQVRVSPTFLSVADNKFEVNVLMNNIGRRTSDSLSVRIVRQFPDKRYDTLFNKKIAPISSVDSIKLEVPIISTRDKGENKIFISLDPDNKIDELCETNNNVTRTVMVFEDDARPIYPAPFSIVNAKIGSFYASTTNPLGKELEYVMELDTTENFNSGFLRKQHLRSTGGLLEFKVTPDYKDSTVYYWRTAVVPEAGANQKWSESSFVYLPNSSAGWNQSHYYQFKKDLFEGLNFTADRELGFTPRTIDFRFFVGVYRHVETTVFINDERSTTGGSGDYLNSICAMIVDKELGKIQMNRAIGAEGVYRSLKPFTNANQARLFFYPHNTEAGRSKAHDFLDSIPNNSTVFIWNWTSDNPTYKLNTQFVNAWKNDPPAHSLYNRFKSLGLHAIDSFKRNAPFFFILDKDKNGVLSVISQQAGSIATDNFNVFHSIESLGNKGKLESIETGIAQKWESLHWNSFQAAPEGDKSVFKLYGLASDRTETLLYSSTKLIQDTTLNFVDAKLYPQLKLVLEQNEERYHQARKLDFWQIKYSEVPEGALSANLQFNSRDTVELGEKLDFKIAFKNVSTSSFDSLNARLTIIDQKNVSHTINMPKLSPLKPGESVVVNPTIDTKTYPGANTFHLEVNPDNAQPEMYQFNNFLYSNLYVRPDIVNPLLDVTFDGVHILNRDIVASKPHILIKLKDEARFMPLDKPELIEVKLTYLEGNGWSRIYKVDGDTLRFSPPANANTDNTATLDFNPHLLEDGSYELSVMGKDESGNSSGNKEYKVLFQTINKAMISNLLNYPNPFTTSTAFVFTLTGSEIPQNMRIQILTITGKIVREITQAELGPIRVGRNITEFKWDGTDQYGQKLANGIYLYRVLTNLNGKSLEKYKAAGDDTDKFFTNGYGKMYLMR